MDVLIYIMPFIGGIIGYLIISALVKAPGRSLARKFVSLGDMRGMTYQEIANVCGPCNSVSSLGDGTKLRQWLSTGYHIALIFDAEDKMVTISHEAAV